MKRFLIVLVMLVPTFLCGCQATLGHIGGWAIWSATATNVTIVNNTKDTQFLVLLNGRIKNQFYIQPGQDFSFEVRNFSDQSKEYCVVVKAYASGSQENVVGVLTKSFSIGGYQANCETWVINTSDLRIRQ